jgi:hypothetical protein
MKRASRKPNLMAGEMGVDEILPEYDFSQSRPNPYASKYQKGSLVITLDPEVVAVFSNATEVNDALRSLAKIVQAQRQRHPRATTKPRSSRTPRKRFDNTAHP